MLRDLPRHAISFTPPIGETDPAAELCAQHGSEHRRSLRAPVVPDALGPRGFAALEVLAQGGGLTAADLDGRFPAVTAAGDAVGALAAYAGAFGLALGVGLPSFFHVILVVWQSVPSALPSWRVP